MANPYDGLTPPEQEETGEVNMGKGLFQSKTFWVNLITAAVSIGTYVMNSDFLANNPEVVAIGGLVIGGLNVVLRLLTGEPIKGIVSAKK